VLTQHQVFSGGGQERFCGNHHDSQSLGMRKGVPRRWTVGSSDSKTTFNEESKVLAHGRLRESHVLNEVSHSMFSGREMLNDSQSRWVSERLEQVCESVCRLRVQLKQVAFYHRHTTMIEGRRCAVTVRRQLIRTLTCTSARHERSEACGENNI